MTGVTGPSGPTGDTGSTGSFAKGTTFPVSPSDGDFFYRTDLDHLFRYDNDRGKWLGELETEGGGRNGTAGSGTYIRRFDGMAYSAALGVYIPYDITIVGISWVMNAGVVGTWEARRSGVSAASAATGGVASGSDMTLNGDFNSGGIFGIYWNSGSNCTDPQIRVYFRRRAT